MVNIIMTDVRRTLMENDVAAFEARFGVVLPDTYRKFLLQHNGGRPNPNIFSMRGSPVSKHGILDWFLCISKNDMCDIGINLGLHDGRIPSNLVPIGEDPGSNLICISVSGDDVGKIYFWEHESGPDEGEEPDYRNVYLIANSFEEFLNDLQDESVLTTRQ